LIGFDVYDTVLVLRTQEAVNAFAHPKISIGAELSVAAGPLGSGGAFDMGFKDKSPAWAYTKSKGFYAGIQLDGTVVIERKDENERFYGRKIKAVELIHAAVSRPRSTNGLVSTIEKAEMREDIVSGPNPPSLGLSHSERWEASAPYPNIDEQASHHAPSSAGWTADSYGALSEQRIASSSSHPKYDTSGNSEDLTPALPPRRSATSTHKYSPGDIHDASYPEDPPPYSGESTNVQTKENGR
jgi:hypothetical protein